jgi:asparagine synthase (glutamine-hydrolysing)
MIKLYKNNTYQWFKKDNVNTIGYAFYKDSLYEDEKLANFIYQSKENLETILQDMNGYFSIVIEEDECIILVSDIIRSFPVFYNNKGDISDDIDVFKRELNELSIEELQQARWVSGDDTIYQNVKQLENASIVYLYKMVILKKRNILDISMLTMLHIHLKN